MKGCLCDCSTVKEACRRGSWLTKNIYILRQCLRVDSATHAAMMIEGSVSVVEICTDYLQMFQCCKQILTIKRVFSFSALGDFEF